MLKQSELDCITAANACAAACRQCATACISEDNPKMMARCIGLDLECADICSATAASLARSGEHAQALSLLCAQACETCSAECGKHSMSHCKHCAEACKRCADLCRTLLKSAA